MVMDKIHLKITEIRKTLGTICDDFLHVIHSTIEKMAKFNCFINFIKIVPNIK